MINKLKLILCGALITLFAGSAALSQDETVTLSAKSLVCSSGRAYRMIFANNAKMDFELSRPLKKDANVLLCIPAAFTSQQGGLCGLYSSHGAVFNENLIDKKMGGALEMEAGKGKIFDTNSGASLNSDFIARLKSKQESFFQQFQVVKSGHAESFVDKSHFQRRCIALLKDGSAAVIESRTEITFNEFGVDLVEMGVEDAVYTDMGPWSEGWYRDGKTGRLISIGDCKIFTDKQTNWFVLKKKI